MNTLVLIFKGKDRTRRYTLGFNTEAEKDELIRGASRVFGPVTDIQILRDSSADQDRDAGKADPIGGKDANFPLSL